MRKRNPEKFVVNYCNTERYGRSAVPFLQRLLNEDYAKQKKDLKCLLQVNNDIYDIHPLCEFEVQRMGHGRSLMT